MKFFHIYYQLWDPEIFWETFREHKLTTNTGEPGKWQLSWLCVSIQAPSVEDKLSEIFDKYSNGARVMDAKEFMHALNAVFRTSM